MILQANSHFALVARFIDLEEVAGYRSPCSETCLIRVNHRVDVNAGESDGCDER
jgi:hypothetical protein